MDLADRFPERTVVTYDPRGVGRSPRADGLTAATPDEHAQDLHRLISHLDVGRVDIFASSGGAVNALALVSRHPERVRTLVAHEPPIATGLDDREEALKAAAEIHDTYEQSGFGPAIAKFVALTSLRGPIPNDFLSQTPRPWQGKSSDRGRREPGSSDARAAHALRHTLRARLRLLARGPHSHRRGGRR
jgi:pimeloyl-ACP methyl ester carboxylesterase